jgi:hypothetical protein
MLKQVSSSTHQIPFSILQYNLEIVNGLMMRPK